MVNNEDTEILETYEDFQEALETEYEKEISKDEEES